ncbi:MAG: hypothetical protein V9H69_10880 [Anaerolineae bacterium]
MVIGAGVLRNRSPWNTLVYFGFTFLTGLILADPAGGHLRERQLWRRRSGLHADRQHLRRLSVFVVVSRKDFSFLGGGLMIALFTLLGLGLSTSSSAPIP